MAVFLQSLDTDGNAANGISVSTAAHAALADVSLNLQSASEAELKALIDQLGQSYVSEEEAMAHVREMLEQYAGITEFDEHVDDSIQTAILATEPVTGLSYQTSSGIEGELDTGTFEYDAGDVLSIFAGDERVAQFDSALIGDDGVITFEEAGFSLTWDELQALLSDDELSEPASEEVEAPADEESDNDDAEASLIDDGGDIFGFGATEESESGDRGGEEEEDSISAEPESEEPEANVPESEQPEGEILYAGDLFEEEQEGEGLGALLGGDEPTEDGSESDGGVQPQSPPQESADGLVDNAALMDNLVGTPNTSSDF